ncbi:MAG: hypothetical protein MUF04_14425 [Akkermansiaceae bacterium]|jgi:hypothetical protein|nr:hypothetical protein [Akkermansiaceae bacterium]
MITLTVTTTGPDVAASAAEKLRNPAGLHARMAGAMERFLKDFGRETSKTEHNTASRLGARPTGHLGAAYEAVESSSSAQAASLWVPGASRLRAAFGPYTVRPGEGRKYLTIPVAREAYGKRAGEIEGLVPMRVGPKKTPILGMPHGGGRMTTYYLLVAQADIPEDAGLIPFEDLYAAGAAAAEKYLLEEEGGTA